MSREASGSMSAWADMTKYHRLGRLKQQVLIFSQFWRLAVQFRVLLSAAHWDKRAWCVGLHDPQVWFFLRPLSFACCLFTGSHLCAHTPDIQISSSYRDFSHIGLRPILVDSFSFNHLFKGPIPKYSHILRYRVKASMYELWRDTIQPTTLYFPLLLVLGKHVSFPSCEVWLGGPCSAFWGQGGGVIHCTSEMPKCKVVAVACSWLLMLGSKETIPLAAFGVVCSLPKYLFCLHFSAFLFPTPILRTP